MSAARRLLPLSPDDLERGPEYLAETSRPLARQDDAANPLLDGVKIGNACRAISA
jgi:hypothetical protein